MLRAFVFFLLSLYLLNSLEGCEVDDSCTTSDGDPGIVKRAVNCELFSIYSRTMPCGFDGIFPLTCCETQETIDEVITFEPSTATPEPLLTTDFDYEMFAPSTLKPSTRTSTATDIDYGFFDDPFSSRISTRPAVSQCTGFGKKPDIDSLVEIRIINGKLSELGEFPHFAMLGYRKDDDTHSFDCGGALISNKFVLTANHCCMRGRFPKIVRLGKVRKRKKFKQKTDLRNYFRLRPT